MQIFEFLQKHKCEVLKEIPNLHQDGLTSFSLWKDFVVWASKFNLETERFKRFFDRQFPTLTGGENVPENISINDGRRPRKIKDIQKRGDVIISKTIDTSYKRFEIFTHLIDAEFKIESKGIEVISESKVINDTRYCYVDLQFDKDAPQLQIQLIKDNNEIESAVFNINNMMWE